MNVMIGVDPHKGSHTASAIDDNERLLDSLRVRATAGQVGRCARRGNKDFQTTELPGLNHLFQHAPTGSPTEYGGIEETMAPEALRSISDWVLKHTTP